jgi:beta-N-acetylhexosaminidase
MALGATRDTALAYAMGSVIAEESRAIGITQDFAPVADVNVNPQNPVINIRSFGENPELVAEMAGAFTSGLQSGGVLATAKHFPGHGDTQTDSHLDLPLVNVSRARMDSVELYPYRALFSRNLGAVMIAHLEVPAYEPRKIPSTLSTAIVDQLLKNKLGFTGLVVTDAMDVGALVNGVGSDSSAVRAVEAGVDVLLILPDEDRAVDALVRAVRSGRIAASRIDASVRKILAVKWDLGLATRRTTALSEIPMHVATPAHLSLAKEIARRAVTVVRNDSILPLERFGTKKILNVIVGDVDNLRTEIHRSTSQWPNEPAGDYFTALLRKRYTQVETIHLDPLSNELSYEALLARAQTAGIILCPIFTKARSGTGVFGLPPELLHVLDTMCTLGKPVIFVAMGSPTFLEPSRAEKGMSARTRTVSRSLRPLSKFSSAKHLQRGSCLSRSPHSPRMVPAYLSCRLSSARTSPRAPG